MRHILISLWVLLFFSTSLSAQNLIQNGSFEEYYSCPVALGDIPIKYWYNPTANTPDYFNSCSIDLSNNVPNNYYGWQYAQDGQAYIGEVTTYPSDPEFVNRDYLTNRLLIPLMKDTIYCLDFYINTPERDTFGCLYDNIGIYFSPDSFWFNIYDTLPFIPQLETPDGIFYNDTVNWIKVEFQYIASGGEKYMTIGNFKSNINTDTLNLDDGTSQMNYYFYDNFSLVKCNPPPPPKEIKIPNVFTPNLDGANEVFKLENLPDNSNLVIFNRWGNIVYSSANYGNNWDGEKNSSGVYYYILTLPTGEVKKGTVTVLK